MKKRKNRKGRVVDINDKTYTSCAVTTGIKKYDQNSYDSSNSYRGSNGTYYHDFQSERVITMTVVAYETEEYNEHTIEFDITDDIRKMNPEWRRITQKRMDAIRNQVVGSKIELSYNQYNGKLYYDPSIFIIR